jgi:cell division protein FtsB
MRWLILIGLFVCFIFLQRSLWFTEGGVPYGHGLKRQIAQQKQTNAKLKHDNARRMREVKALKKGGAAIEEHARTDLGWVKQGETFYQIVRVPPGTTVPHPLSVPAPIAATGG